jgi:hypothetical protein
LCRIVGPYCQFDDRAAEFAGKRRDARGERARDATPAVRRFDEQIL